MGFGGDAVGHRRAASRRYRHLPVINTGIAHKEAGVGQIGAGITHAPLDCFAKAVTALAAEVA